MQSPLQNWKSYIFFLKGPWFSESTINITITILKFVFLIKTNNNEKIKLAIKELKMNEILIVAGKGHEKFQVLKNKTIKFDDFTVVKQLLN